MPENQFDHSRISEGTLNVDAQTPSSNPPRESSAISRDDVRDGVPESDTVARQGSDHESRTEGLHGNNTGVDNTHGAASEHFPGRPRRVLTASTLKGDRVRNTAGEMLGTIDEIMIDLPTGQVAYAVLSFGGFLGIGDKLFAVPWKALRVDEGEHEFILDADRAMLDSAPGFDKSNWPDMADAAFAGKVNSHYGVSEAHPAAGPTYQHEVTDAGDYIGVDEGSRPYPNRSTEFEPTAGFRQDR